MPSLLFWENDMAKQEKLEKTNAVRKLDSAGLGYTLHTYDSGGGALDAVTVAQKLGLPPELVYKTLVTMGHSKNIFVFVIPGALELDLKAAARSVGEKSVEMVQVADINRLTGYVRGGCSPIGMKRAYTTVLDSSCEQLSSMIVSAGKIGLQVELAPSDLAALIGARLASVAKQ